MQTSRRLLTSSLALLVLALAAFVFLSRTGTAPRRTYVPYSDARPILESLSDRVPAELRSLGGPDAAARWLDWARRRDREIRGRLARGDEDTVVNLMLFGTSFTEQPRVGDAELEQVVPDVRTGRQISPEQIGPLIQRRAAAFVDAAAAGGGNGRLDLARLVFRQQGFDLTSAAGRSAARGFLFAGLLRVTSEQVGYARALEEARRLGDPTREFAESSRLYRDRGLSLDTSLRPGFAIEESLAMLLQRGMVEPNGVRRVAVVGPGLDFADKHGGYDFYPEQSIQPFAVMDSLLRLGLADAGTLVVTTLDLSPRVNAHLASVRHRASGGEGYTLQLPRDPEVGWREAFVRYWERFGDQIGSATPPAALPPGLEGLELRAVRVRAELAARVQPIDLNLVLERLEGEAFDLIVATNVLIYYDVFEQCLALKNVERMLRPGGFLLSNNAVLELPSSRVRSAGYLTASYSHEGDHIVWYRREP